MGEGEGGRMFKLYKILKATIFGRLNPSRSINNL